ncbi:MAG: TolC family protein [Planctomycetota bacterium]|nr:MAG: TolC family protein [Planctomycetota bacterium]
MPHAVSRRLRQSPAVAGAAVLMLALVGACRTSVPITDREIAAVIAQRQRQALAYTAPPGVVETDPRSAEPDASAYEPAPHAVNQTLPPGFEQADETDDARKELDALLRSASQSEDPTSRPTRPVERYRDHKLTLTEALAYATQHRRELQDAKEDLYLAALALTVERHLWTPLFAAELRTVYGNFGEVTDFDQAMRFVADLSVSQRLPYGGEFTARAVSTLIRDVKKTITASEGSTIDLTLRVPFLRGAGHVARESLYSLERELTYAVRTYERFRRRQLVTVAQEYFDLLRSKQAVIDGHASIARAIIDYERARVSEERGIASAGPLDTRRAEQRLLSEVNRTEQLRESFRFATDQFKLTIGMPVDERLGLDDLEDIESIEQQIEEGKYPLLRRTAAVDDEDRALEVATQLRLDLLTARDRVDDARRGVDVAQNALLPFLDWESSLGFDTDPEHFRLGGFEFARAEWRSEVILRMDDRFRERADYRESIIDVRRAQRRLVDQLERVRVDVRRARNQIHLQDRVVEIQRRNLTVAEARAEFARIQYEKGQIGNRDLVEAEDELVRAQNNLNQAKTERWSALLDFRLATETLIIDDNGVQRLPPNGG